MKESFARPAPIPDITGLKTILLVNNQVISLTPFVQKYIAGVLCGILKSFGEHPHCGMKAFGGDLKVLTVCIDSGELGIYTEDRQLDLKKDFARKLVKGTIRGMLSALDGTFAGEHITIHVNCKD